MMVPMMPATTTEKIPTSSDTREPMRMRENTSRPRISVPRICSAEPPSSQHGGCAILARSISSGVQGIMTLAKTEMSTTTRTIMNPSMPEGLFSRRRGRSNRIERSRACFFASEDVFVLSAIALSSSQ